MWTGRNALASIDGAIAKLHGEESQLDHAFQSALAGVERLRQERAQAFRELARVKLDEIASGRLVSNLDAAERRAVSLLDGRRSRLDRAVKARDQAAQALAAAQTRQSEAARKVEEVLGAIDALRQRTEAGLADDPFVRAARDDVASAQSVAEEARRKAEQNAAELGAKKKPYDEDPLFQYLWARGFGTASYAHGGITRAFDRMVAHFIGYLDVRANYHMLNEIPVRLREHAEAREAAVAEARAELARIEREALAKAGMAALEGDLARARAELAHTEEELEQARAALAKADAEREAIFTGSADPAYAEALGTIASADAGDDMATLYAEASRTPTTADEKIVRQIERINGEITRAEAELAQLRTTARQLAERRADVERTRDRFRRSGYDHPNATFGNERAIADALGGILSGALKGAVLWDVLRGGYANHPPASRPDFGGGFPFPMPGNWGGGVSGGGWRDPGSSGSWSPGPDPSTGGSWGGGGGGNDSDNFTTGGRF